MDDAIAVKLRHILEASDANQTKMQTYYNACMNMTAINGVDDSLFKSMVYWPLVGLTALEDRLTFLLSLGIPAFIDVEVGTDDKNASAHALFLMQGGLGLPSPEYYINQTVQTSPVLEAYHQQVADMFALLNQSDASPVVVADDVIAMETALASAFTPQDELLDPEAVYNPMSIPALTAMAPAVNWTRYFQGNVPGCRDCERRRLLRWDCSSPLLPGRFYKSCKT